MRIVKARKLGVRSKIILFSKTVQDYGNRSPDVCFVMWAGWAAGHSLSTYVYTKISMVRSFKTLNRGARELPG